jgi:arsenate reductase
MTITLYGIPNCDQIKKSRTWLDEQGVAYTFHDFKKAGIKRDIIENWLQQQSWETVLNRKGTTWRTLSDARKASIVDAAGAVELMVEMPSIIKRPVLSIDGETHVGFSKEKYQQIFKK